MKRVLFLSVLFNTTCVNAMTGGWYPMFFDNLSYKNESQLDDLLIKANNGCIKSATLSYDRNEKLKNQIVSYLHKKENLAKSNLNLKIEHEANSDESNVSYAHDRVVITVYSKKCQY